MCQLEKFGLTLIIQSTVLNFSVEWIGTIVLFIGCVLFFSGDEVMRCLNAA